MPPATPTPTRSWTPPASPPDRRRPTRSGARRRQGRWRRVIVVSEHVDARPARSASCSPGGRSPEARAADHRRGGRGAGPSRRPRAAPSPPDPRVLLIVADGSLKIGGTRGGRRCRGRGGRAASPRAGTTRSPGPGALRGIYQSVAAGQPLIPACPGLRSVAVPPGDLVRGSLRPGHPVRRHPRRARRRTPPRPRWCGWTWGPGPTAPGVSLSPAPARTPPPGGRRSVDSVRRPLGRQSL